MNHIQDMIKKLCPNGVKWVKLGDVCEKIASGKCTDKSTIGQYPVYGSTGIIARTDTFKYDCENILVARVGANAGMVNKVSGKYDVTDNTLIVTPSEKLNLKYGYYFLTFSNINQYAKGGGQPLITGGFLQHFPIPLPPLPIQQSIVDVLDKFEAMRNNLNAELALRRKQYEHFREKLLTFGDDVKRVKLDCVISNLRTGLNPRVHFKLNTVDATGYYVTVRELKGFDVVFDEKTDKINKTAIERINERSVLQVGDILFSGTGTIGRTALIKKQPTNWNIKEGVYALTPIKEKVLSRYLIFLFHTQYFMGLIDLKAGGSTVKSIPMSEFKNLTIPLPSLEVQNSIVAKLDKFEALISNIERELELRTKQYEYYREKLLTF